MVVAVITIAIAIAAFAVVVAADGCVRKTTAVITATKATKATTATTAAVNIPHDN